MENTMEMDLDDLTVRYPWERLLATHSLVFAVVVFGGWMQQDADIVCRAGYSHRYMSLLTGIVPRLAFLLG